MAKPKRIFIVGHLGAGKALLGKALAEELNYQFIDANLALERQTGRELKDIIGNQGIDPYVETLSKILSNHVEQNNIVVTTDDCIILSEKNRKALSSEFVVYLKVNTAEQLKRMSDGPLPLLPIADKKAFFDKLHHERDNLFEEVATLTIELISVEEDIKKIMKAFEE